MKKGFTLIELLVVIILIAAIVLLAIPKITNSVKNYNTNVDKTTLNIIKEATKLYISDNESLYPKGSQNTYCISLNELIEKDYLKNTIQYNNQDITNTKVMKVTYDNGFNYELVNKKDCKILPEEYQQVEYIESTGTQYIDTGFVISSNVLKIETDFMITNWETSKGLYGSQTASDSNWSFNPYVNSSLSKNYWNYHIGTTGSAFSIYIEDNEWHNSVVSANNGTYEISLNNELQKSGSYSGTIVNGSNFSIFTINNMASRVSKAKIKTFKIIQDNNVVRNYIPCYRKSDGVIGLYDLVEDKFYTNSGTGTFVKGKDI